MIKLEPCPFCGAATHVDYDTASEMFGPEADHQKGCLLQNWDMHDFADANLLVEVWNTRTPSADRPSDNALHAAEIVAGLREYETPPDYQTRLSALTKAAADFIEAHMPSTDTQAAKVGEREHSLKCKTRTGNIGGECICMFTPSPVTDETALSGEVKGVITRLESLRDERNFPPHLLDCLDEIANHAETLLAALASTPLPPVAEGVDKAAFISFLRGAGIVAHAHAWDVHQLADAILAAIRQGQTAGEGR